MSTRTTWIAAYDIPEDRRRLKIANLLNSHGDRIQRSVFIITVNTQEHEALMKKITEIAAASTDIVQMFKQCSTCRESTTSLGQSHIPREQHWWII